MRDRKQVINLNGFEKRTEEKKKNILEAAFELMNRNEVGKNITMDKIAKHANVGKATLFKYFGSKDNLIHEVFKYYLEKMIDTASDIMNENKPFDETLIALSQNKIKFLNQINQSFYLKMMAYLTEKDEEGWCVMMQKYTQENYGMMLDLFHRP